MTIVLEYDLEIYVKTAWFGWYKEMAISHCNTGPFLYYKQDGLNGFYALIFYTLISS